MKLRALLSLALSAGLLSGCGTSVRNLAATSLKGAIGAKDAPAAGVDPAPFLATVNQATGTVNKNPGWRNPVLVSIEGHGLDQAGRLVPLLGGSWVFKYWANKVEDGKMNTDFSMVEVVHHVEGTEEVLDTGEIRQTDVVRALDPTKLSQPTQLVPFAIRLGLKVSRQGAGYNYYDVTYNAFYADPSSADANVADVSAYYQSSVQDMLHIPADAGLLPIVTPVIAPPKVVTPAKPVTPTPKRATAQEAAADQARDRMVMGRQHVN